MHEGRVVLTAWSAVIVSYMVVVSQCGDLPGDNISKGSHCTHIPVCYCSWRM